MLDISLHENIFVLNELDAAIQELDILFNTENTELIGYTSYGTNWWNFLWVMTPQEGAITQYIEEKIASTYFLSKFKTQVEVQYTPGTINSIYYIKIGIYNEEGEQLSIQQFELK